ncbi:substrate-binding domain-containing protein [Hoeflea poritis]|uniref:Substrate-binding domain-containing protein n=1 Tax=Hoeflea poritis TaxID=2993659 RepID=A0ABT4VIP5_9HYPH|nr:substrate-binding domain-containing protein [Hoeflea poritis]MDA4844050.1 substrate-binding domain-containing protein [Hoeflea poritis]
MSVNLKQLAEALGISQTTVSRALNGFPEVSEKTRRKVLDMAQQLNYSPSPHAKKLATGKSKTIGHVVPQSDHMMINPLFSDFIAGVGEVYSGAGYDMLMSIVPRAQEENTYHKLIASKRVDGMMVHAPLVNDTRIALLQKLKMPFVVHGRSADDDDSYSWLDINNRRSFERATRFLADLGHRRIGLLNGLESMTFAQRRRMGYMDALKEAQIDADPQIMFSEDMMEPYGYRCMHKMLALANPPTAVLCSSILPALGALRAIQEAGMEPGRDISIVTHDDMLSFLSNSGDIPMFTALRSSIKAAGKRCAEMLIDAIENPGMEPSHELWETELVIGGSTGPARS